MSENREGFVRFVGKAHADFLPVGLPRVMRSECAGEIDDDLIRADFIGNLEIIGYFFKNLIRSGDKRFHPRFVLLPVNKLEVL